MKELILLLSIILVCGCVKDAREEIVCNKPYILVGNECCLDVNDNKICDVDETTTTSTTTSTTITTTSTTSTTTTTTTTLPIACFINSDCGQRIEEKVCYRGDVYIRLVTPICMKPGKLESYCIQRISFSGASIDTEPTPFERCSRGCENGTCL
ncbi:MAG: hypothetical protein JW778_04060 [Candidatus Altiarchaeota archaeon]|nr:hypothetical protein [Candidatus Altiarchaeota archaeon]